MATPETCARCGAKFECGSKSGAERCWCQDLPAVLPPNPSESCLCPDCLKKEIAARQKAEN